MMDKLHPYDDLAGKVMTHIRSYLGRGPVRTDYDVRPYGPGIGVRDGVFGIGGDAIALYAVSEIHPELASLIGQLLVEIHTVHGIYHRRTAAYIQNPPVGKNNVGGGYGPQDVRLDT